MVTASTSITKSSIQRSCFLNLLDITNYVHNESISFFTGASLLLCFTIQWREKIVLLCIDSFSTKLENAASKVVKDGQSVSTSLTYEDQPQPQPKVNIILIKEKLLIILSSFTCIWVAIFILYTLIFLFCIFFLQRETKPTQESH